MLRKNHWELIFFKNNYVCGMDSKKTLLNLQGVIMSPSATSRGGFKEWEGI